MAASRVSPSQIALQVSTVVDGVQRSVDNTAEQYLATAALGLVFLVVTWVIYLGGPALKRRFTDESVDIARTLTIMVVAMACAGIFVVIWEVEDTVESALLDLFPANPERTIVVLFVAILVLLGTYVLTRVTKRIVRRWSERGRISPHQRELAHHAIQIGLFVVALAFIVALFNQDPGDLFLGAGVLGVVIGFAARKTLSGVLSGFVILVGRPFEAGDWIAVGDREGIVTEITIFNTQIRTFNEEHVLVPNDRVTDREIINYSKTDRLRIVTEVGVDYDVDIDEAATIAKETIEGCDSVADTPGPDVVLDSFGDSAVILQLRYWIDTPTIQRKLGTRNEVIDSVKKAFESEGVKIPYPQRELLGREETDGLRLSSGADVSVGDEVERAVRRVRADSTAVAEPVEDRYRDDDEMAGNPEAATADADESEEAVADEGTSGDDSSGPSDGDGTEPGEADADGSGSDAGESDVGTPSDEEETDGVSQSDGQSTDGDGDDSTSADPDAEAER